MTNVDDQVRDGLRALADVPDVPEEQFERDVLQRIARRRRRRHALSAAAAGLAVVGALGGALAATQASGDDADVATGDPGPGGPRSTPQAGAEPHTNAPVSIALERGTDGGVTVVFTFERPLPASPPQAVPGIESVPRQLGGIAYTTQQGGPDAVIHQCATTHFGFGPLPLETGSVDVFFPAAWVPPGFDPFEDVTVDTGVRPDDTVPPGEWDGKFVACGPYEGYLQYSVWAPPSDDLDDVNLSVSDANRLVVEIRP